MENRAFELNREIFGSDGEKGPPNAASVPTERTYMMGDLVKPESLALDSGENDGLELYQDVSKRLSD